MNPSCRILAHCSSCTPSPTLTSVPMHEQMKKSKEGREEEVHVAVVTRSGQRHTPSSDDEPHADAPTILRPPTERPEVPPQIFPPLRFTFKQPLVRVEDGESAQPAEGNLEVLGQVNAEGPLRRSIATRPKSKVPWVGKEGRQDSIEESVPIRAGPRSYRPREPHQSMGGPAHK